MKWFQPDSFGGYVHQNCIFLGFGAKFWKNDPLFSKKTKQSKTKNKNKNKNKKQKQKPVNKGLPVRVLVSTEKGGPSMY